MVAQNTTRVHCIVLEIPATRTAGMSATRLQRELLPWADPYIAGLVERVKSEILAERALKAAAAEIEHLSLEESTAASLDDTIAALGERFEFFDPDHDEWSDWEDA